MTHSVHPYSHRLGIIRDWKSRWFGAPGKFPEYLKADVLLREFLEKRLRGFYVDSIEMERSRNAYRVIIKTSRPGMIIGRQGDGSIKLKNDIGKFLAKIGVSTPKEIKLDIEEIRDPDASAPIVAYGIAEALEKRLPFRRVMKMAMDRVMADRNVQGIKVTLSGRLGGSEMGRVESMKQGRVPLSTLRADIDFFREKAYLSYGVIGVKVWIYRGEIFSEKNKK
jgi:small subunit ribosomal protein S3